MTDDVRRVHVEFSSTNQVVAAYERPLSDPFKDADHALMPWKDYERLKADVKFWNETAIEYKRQLNETIRRGPESAGLHIITTDQINAAWRCFEAIRGHVCCRATLKAALYELGIVACEECGGLGQVWPDLISRDYHTECSTCHGRGWVMEER